MNIKTVLLVLGLLLCKIQAQICGYGGPTIITSSISGLPPTNPSQIISAPQVLTTPLFGTTTIDNSLSKTLANVLQLLIVSDLIESTLRTIVGLRSAPFSNSVCEPIISQPIVSQPFVSQPIVYKPTIDVITPVTEYIQPSCSPVIEYIPSCSPVVDYTSPCGRVFDCTPQCGPVIDYTPSYGTVFEFTPSCGQFIEPLPNFYGGITECITSSNCCGGVPEFISSVTNVGPMYTHSFSSNNFSGLQEIIGPIQMAPQVPNCCNGFPEIINPVCNTGLFPTEILLPSAIPAQLICNIESIVPNSLPHVSVNVEPLPCGCGCNHFLPNSYFY